MVRQGRCVPHVTPSKERDLFNQGELGEHLFDVDTLRHGFGMAVHRHVGLELNGSGSLHSGQKQGLGPQAIMLLAI